jgi:photosystem II stability/assembly factor-like uncharacterized protein
MVTVMLAPAAASASVPKANWYWTMVVSPTSDDVLVLGTNSGLYRSTNGGKSWQPVGPKDFNATSVVNSGSSMLAAGVKQPPSKTAVLTRNGNLVVEPGPSVVFASEDGGQTWHAVHPTGLGPGDVQALAVDPSDTRSVVALLSTGRVYRSFDGGGSFKLVSSSVGAPPWAVAVTGGGFVAGNMRTGSYTSATGMSWKAASFKDARGTRMVMEYAVQPGNLAHVLMTAYGVVSSTDGGKTWRPSLRSTVMFGPAAWAPGTTEVAYAVGFDGSLWRTDNAGATWKKVT